MKIKKLLFLSIISFFITGCYDYQEITDLGIIVSLGIDYQNDEYIITYEILEDNKDKQSGITSSYAITGKDKLLAKAFENTSDKIAKKAYYSHIDIVLFSKEIVANHFQEVTDYLLRNKDIREDFDAVIVDDPQKILSNTNPKMLVIGSNILESLKSYKFSNGISLEKKYSDVISDILAYGKDTVLPVININNNEIILNGLAAFNKYHSIYYLNDINSKTYNLLNNSFKNIVINKKYKNKDLSISIFKNKLKIDIDKKNIIIAGKVKAEILNNSPNFDIKNPQVIKKLEKDFSVILNNNIDLLIKDLQMNNTDILGLTNSYYQKTRDKNNEIWLNAQVKSNVDLIISKKGIIYEVKNDE